MGKTLKNTHSVHNALTSEMKHVLIIDQIFEELKVAKETLLKFLTVEQLAERWGVSKSYIYNRLSAKTFKIRPVRIGRLVRFRIEDIEKFEATM